MLIRRILQHQAETTSPSVLDAFLNLMSSGDNEGQNRGGTSDDANVVVRIPHHNSVLVPGHVPLPHRDHTHVVVAKPLRVSDQLAV